jgi:cytoskeletal protein RodZ
MITTGDLLKQERTKRNLTLEDVEKATRIRKKSLHAVELGLWNEFDSKTYILGIIRTYGKFLKLDEEKLLAFFRREYEKKEDIRFKKRMDTNRITPQKKTNFKIIVGVVCLLFMLYFGYQIKVYLTPPKVVIVSPKQKVFKIEDHITVVGQTEKDAIVTVNGQKVYPDSTNTFTYLMSLKEGNNIVKIEATGANGKKSSTTATYTKKGQ